MMELLLGILFLATVAMLVFLIDQGQRNMDAERRRVADEFEKERQEWSEERQVLLERIQRPEYRPVMPTREPTVEEQPYDDELHLVGQIQMNDSPPE